MKMKEVLLIILNDYADWEGAFLASSLNAGVLPGSEVVYTVKTVAPSMEPVRSIGGFRTLPDYDFGNMPEDYAAVVLIGGYSWQSPEACGVEKIVKRTLENGKPVGAICNAVSFMCAHGFLNNVKHTGNTLQQLELYGGKAYTNRNGYVEAQAVSDSGIVTANGSGYLEFTRELLTLLGADTPERIAASYDFFKNGLVR